MSQNPQWVPRSVPRSAPQRSVNSEPKLLLFSDDPAGTRTQDLRIKSPLLYQLSYAPTRFSIGSLQELLAVSDHEQPSSESGMSANHRLCSLTSPNSDVLRMGHTHHNI